MKQDELNFSYAAHKKDSSDWTEKEMNELADVIVDWVESKDAYVGGGISLRNGDVDIDYDDDLLKAARELRQAQKDYMADRDNESLGKIVGEKTKMLDKAIVGAS